MVVYKLRNTIFFLLLPLWLFSQKSEAFKEGERYYRQGKFKAAEGLLKQAVDENPHNATAYFYLGMIGMVKKDYAMAETNLQKAIGLDKDESVYVFNYAWLELIQAKWEGAQKYFEKAASMRPQDWRIAESKAQLFFKQFLFEKTADQLEKTLLLRPDHPERKAIEKLIVSLRKKAPRALEIRDSLLERGQALDISKYLGIFSIDFSEIKGEANVESKSAEKIDDFDIEIDAVE